MTSIADVRARFVSDTREHSMTVLREDGLYRHVRFSMPDASFYRFDLVTWPGYLAIVGDCEDFVFCRNADMFEFFSGDGYGIDGKYGINPNYWSQKLVAPKSSAAETYSVDAYRAAALQWFEDQCDALDVLDSEDPIDAVFGLRLAVQEQLLDEPWWGEHSIEHEEGARQRLREFEWTPPGDAFPRARPLRIEDSWEWSLTDYDFHFLWVCWAIVWGIEQYRAVRPAVAVAA